MNKVSKKLLPFRNYNESNVINMYALDGTGEQGMFVKVSVGDMDDNLGILSDAVAAQYDHSYAPNFGVKAKVVAAESGDSRLSVLGMTLKNTLTTDENGLPLKFDATKANELDAVVPGQAVPVVTKGIFTFGSEGYTVEGVAPSQVVTASVGDVVTLSNAGGGIVDVVPVENIVASPADATEYTDLQVIGKVIATGASQGGYIVASISL